MFRKLKYWWLLPAALLMHQLSYGGGSEGKGINPGIIPGFSLDAVDGGSSSGSGSGIRGPALAAPGMNDLIHKTAGEHVNPQQSPEIQQLDVDSMVDTLSAHPGELFYLSQGTSAFQKQITFVNDRTSLMRLANRLKKVESGEVYTIIGSDDQGTVLELPTTLTVPENVKFVLFGATKDQGVKPRIGISSEQLNGDSGIHCEAGASCILSSVILVVSGQDSSGNSAPAVVNQAGNPWLYMDNVEIEYLDGNASNTAAGSVICDQSVSSGGTMRCARTYSRSGDTSYLKAGIAAALPLLALANDAEVVSEASSVVQAASPVAAAEGVAAATGTPSVTACGVAAFEATKDTLLAITGSIMGWGNTVYMTTSAFVVANPIPFVVGGTAVGALYIMNEGRLLQKKQPSVTGRVLRAGGRTAVRGASSVLTLPKYFYKGSMAVLGAPKALYTKLRGNKTVKAVRRHKTDTDKVAAEPLTSGQAMAGSVSSKGTPPASLHSSPENSPPASPGHSPHASPKSSPNASPKSSPRLARAGSSTSLAHQDGQSHPSQEDREGSGKFYTNDFSSSPSNARVRFVPGSESSPEHRGEHRSPDSEDDL